MSTVWYNVVLNGVKLDKMKAEGYVTLTHEFRKEGRRWTAHCKELGTATFGRSLTEADKRLSEAVCLNLNVLEDVGERDRFFREHDIKFQQSRPRKNITISTPVDKDVFVRPFIQRVPVPEPC